MKLWLPPLLIAAITVSSSLSLAVDESRLWLPKKYRALKPQLMAAAEMAEKSYRCKKVVAGKMIFNKTTAENYYFVVTCRDEKQKSYSLSYLSPVNGGKPELLAEQGRLISSQITDESDSTTDEQAQTICRNALFDATATMKKPKIVESEILLAYEDDSRFAYTLPFDVQSKQMNPLRYQADCKVDKQSGVTLTVKLQSEGALMLCKEALPEETVLLKQVELKEQSIIGDEGADGFHFQIPFKAITLHKEKRHFKAFCHINEHGESELTNALDPAYILAICNEEISKQSKNMLDVIVLDGQEDAMKLINGAYSGLVNFDARNPGGRSLHYQASCQVNQNGSSTVKIGPRK